MTFTKQEVRDLLNKVIMDEVSFTRMVEIMNERVNERVSEILNKRVSEAEDIHEKPKKGDLAIFWDEVKGDAIIKFYKKSNESEEYFRHKDKNGFNWVNAIRFESKEQYERFIKGEI